jgi:hypothetical protein
VPQDEFVDEDPMELVGFVMPGEAGQLERMAEVIVEEYVRMGWDEKRLMVLFVNPMFQATYRVYQLKGEAYVRELLHKTCAKYCWTTAKTPAASAAKTTSPDIPTVEVNHA